MLNKIPKQEYTPEFRELSVKRVKTGLSVGFVARELGLIEQTPRNWVKAAAAGKVDISLAGNSDDEPTGSVSA